MTDRARGGVSFVLRIAPPQVPPRNFTMTLAIDIISDVVCPWCFIGKRRIEAALALYRARKPAAAAPQVTYHPCELNPDVPREGVARADYIAKKFGARGYSAHDRLVQAGKPLGIAFAFDRI